MRRHELSDREWAIIHPLLPQKSRGVPRVDDRRVINGILWRFRAGTPWRDVPERYGPRTTLYNRFTRWRAAGAVLGAPPLAWVAPPVYRLVAEHRHELPGGTAACALPPRAG